MIYTDIMFGNFRDDLLKHYEEELYDEDLFKLNVDNNLLFDKYLNSFKNEQLHKTNKFHDCSACRKFFKKAGNICTIKKINNKYKIITLFDYTSLPEYNDTLKILAEYLHEEGRINEAFLSSKNRIGIDKNYEELNGNIIPHNHLYIDLSSNQVKEGKQLNKLLSEYKVNKELLEASIKELSLDSINTVINLIEENNLYRGIQWKNPLTQFREVYYEYYSINDTQQKELCLWYNSRKLGSIISRIKNHSIGTLLYDLTEGKELEEALKKYESIVAPTNYKRPKPVFSESMVKNAEKKIKELGFLQSLSRRYANIDDLDLHDTLFLNKKIKNNLNEDVFNSLLKEAVHKPREFKYVDEYNLNDFLNKVLPYCKDIEIYFNADNLTNLVSLITSTVKDAPSMFQWDNNYTWSYKNNLTDSNIRENVKKMGGDVDVDLRFSIQWNDNTWDRNDLDAHCLEPNNNLI